MPLHRRFQFGRNRLWTSLTRMFWKRPYIQAALLSDPWRKALRRRLTNMLACSLKGCLASLVKDSVILKQFPLWRLKLDWSRETDLRDTSAHSRCGKSKATGLAISTYLILNLYQGQVASAFLHAVHDPIWGHNVDPFGSPFQLGPGLVARSQVVCNDMSDMCEAILFIDSSASACTNLQEGERVAINGWISALVEN